MSTENDRRAFFSQAGRDLGDMAVNALGAPAAFVTKLVLPTNLSTTAIEAKSSGRTLLLRSREAVTQKGEPFGDKTLCGVFLNYGLQNQPRGFLVLGHQMTQSKAASDSEAYASLAKELQKKSSGITVLDLAYSENTNRWDWVWKSESNLRFHGATPVPVEEANSFSEQVGVGDVHCAVLTPWNTVLFGETELLELNLETATLVRRRHLGFLNPRKMYLYTVAGRPVVLYALSQQAEGSSACKVLKYVTQGVYDPRNRNTNELLFSAESKGTLYEANFETNQWQTVNNYGHSGAILQGTQDQFQWQYLKENDWPELSQTFQYQPNLTTSAVGPGANLPPEFPRVLTFETANGHCLEVLCTESDSKIFSKCLF